MTRKNEKQYVSDNAQLMTEWNWEKNTALGFNPETLSYGSAIKVWWKCQKGHEWEANPNHRSRSRGCPICAKFSRTITLRKNIIAQRGALSIKNPDLAKQWHPTKNSPLTPNEITANSPQRVWWICDKAHEWEAPINSRNSGIGCPVCAGYKIIVGINDLSTVRPDLAKQWHPTKNGELKPTQVTVGNDKNVWWKCQKGHEWNAKISNRTHGNNCPICIGKKTLAGYNDLATTMPSLILEWHPTKNGILTPQNFTAYSNKKVWWKCRKGHEWQSTISHRSIGRRCPICFGESRTSFPEQAIFFYFRQVTPTLNRYKLDAHTEIDVYLPEYRIGIEYDGIYFHNNQKALEREKRKQEKLDNCDITLFRVKETKEYNNGTIQNNVIYVKPGANDMELSQVIQTLCSCITNSVQHSLHLDIDITRDRNKIYEQYIQSEKENSLAMANPLLASEWHPTKNGTLSPQNITPGCNKKAWWKCNICEYEWQAVISSRNKGHGCPICARKKNNK